jgi:hypothetical protein
MAHASLTQSQPQSQPQSQSQSPRAASVSRRASKTGSHPDLSFSTPESNRDANSRKRSRGPANSDAVTTPAHDEDDADGPFKAGHSLRKRARVNYATEQIEDEVTVPNSSSLSRLKKRRSDTAEDLDGLNNTPSARKRGGSFSADTPSSRRRNPSRKSAEMKAYREDFDDDDGDANEDAQDVIRVDDLTPSVASPAEDPELGQSTPTPESAGANKAPQNSDLPTTTLDTRALNADDAKQSTASIEQLSDGDPSEQIHRESSIGPDQQLQQDLSEPKPDLGGAAPLPAPAPTSSPLQKAEVKSSPITSVLEQHDSLIQSPEPMQLDPPAPATKNEQELADVNMHNAVPLDPQLVESSRLSAEPSAVNTADAQMSEEQDKAAKSASPSASPKVEAEEKSEPTAEVSADAPADELDPNRPSVEELGNDISINSVQSAELPSIEEKDLPLSTQSPRTEPVDAVSKPTDESLPLASKEATPARRPFSKPQPHPVGRWSHLTPYVDGEYTSYPEKKVLSDDDDASEDQSPEEKDTSKEPNDGETAVEENEEVPDIVVNDMPTPGLNTPLRGSPVPESLEVTALNSPVLAGDEAEDAETTESQDVVETRKHFNYRKLRDPEEFISIIDNYEDMSTAELYEMLEAVNVSLVSWQEEWSGLGKIVDDYENASRRRIADAKYEARTRNIAPHSINYEEPDFVVKGYKSKEKEIMSETRYLQAQDRIMAATYGFEYDPHPSKIGRQNPDTQQAGVTTRGRSLRNQPRQTAKATEADGGVTGKRQRKPVQLFDPAPQDVSRSSTPVPTRGRRRKNADTDDLQQSFASSFNGEDMSDGEVVGTGPGRRRRGPRPRAQVPDVSDEYVPASQQKPMSSQDDHSKVVGRRGRPKNIGREDLEPQSESKHQKSRMLTLKIPKGNFSEQSSAITDNGDSRPSTASSDSTSHTAESSYSFRPKRQKRFRDQLDDSEESSQPPPKKRGRRSGHVEPSEREDSVAGGPFIHDTSQPPVNRKGPKIKVMRPPQGSRNGTPLSQTNAEDGNEQPKEYRAMTKSEKMSASMKSEFSFLSARISKDIVLMSLQIDGPTETWQAQSKSARRLWRRRRRLRRPPIKS